MQQHQPHEPFFSFTVPPKPNLLHPQHPSGASLQPSHHPHSHLLSSIITDLDCHRSHLDPSSRSPSSASPSGPSSANRPGTAGLFAFNVPSGTPSTTPSSSNTRLSPNHPPTSASSLAPSIDRPYSSSGLSLTNVLPHQSLNHSQTPGSSHAITHDHHNKSAARSSFPNSTSNLPRSGHPSPPAQMSNCAVNVHPSRPMTAPGSAWVGSHHLGDGLDFASAHVGLFHQAPPYSLQPNGLSASTLSKTASADFPSGLRHATHPSPDPSSAHPGVLDPITQAPHGPSSASSDPDSILHDYAGQSVSPVRGPSATGRQSLGAHSTESTPESPDSPDADQSLGYIHSMPPNNVYHPHRPNTHSGAYNTFGRGDRFLPQQSAHPRPATGYPPLYDPTCGYSSIPPQAHQHYGPRPPMFPTHSSQIFATGAGNYSHGPGSLEPQGQERLYNFNILPGAPRKRARRRFDEVERLYDCNYPGCAKAYGTLNHLNAHISMQKHGPKRLPQEFKEIRKEWRARKKAEAEARALALKQAANQMGATHDYNAMNGGQDSFRRHNVGVSNDSSPSGSSTSGSFVNHHIRSPAVGSGSYSAPAHSQQFALPDPHAEWYNEHRTPSTIDEQAEYLPTSTDSNPNNLLAALPPTHQSLPPSSLAITAASHDPIASFDHQQQRFAVHLGHHLPTSTPTAALLNSHLNSVHRPSQIHLSHPSSIVDHS
ncbi:hypothetical protein PGT21_015946 [Puccinia graminis f. sp. tritici]|uniref:C2H2-type domain-containing protein n=1 Tax=Puccinia graminis f. sp. tritici TaxID=56615 RepID=A0A5B0MRB8_PUCGR|nr:hypothetical protein PGT21_015946 [Puccinia graminis f. sp. tritici]